MLYNENRGGGNFSKYRNIFKEQGRNERLCVEEPIKYLMVQQQCPELSIIAIHTEVIKLDYEV